MKRAVAAVLLPLLLAAESSYAQEEIPEPPDEAEPADEPRRRERSEHDEERERMERELEEWDEERRERKQRQRRRRERRYEDEEYDDRDERPRGPGYHEHDGFYLHMGLGVGYLQARNDEAGIDLLTRGTAVGFDVDVGGAVMENFLLYGTFAFMSVEDADVVIGGDSVNVLGTYSMAVGALGLGAAFYLSRVNLRFAAELASAQLQGTMTSESDDYPDDYGTTDWGAVVRLGVAKEWWVGHNWGLGASVDVSVGELPERDSGIQPWQIFSLIVGFSSTFN